MTTPLIGFDGGSVKGLMDVSALSAGVDAPLTTVQYCYRYVPWFRRGVSLRANTLASVPFTIANERKEDVTDIPEMASLMRWIRSFLHITELSTTLYGAAYHVLEANRYKLNITPRHIPTMAVGVNHRGMSRVIESFSVFYTDLSATVPPDQMVWVWEPNPDSEREPGPALGQTALLASGMLAALDRMATDYFKNGAVPVHAVMVPPSTPRKERDALEDWFTRTMGGFRRAWKFLTVNRDTEIKKIGSDIRETQAPELTASARDNVAVALEVPPTVLDGKSANHATADSEMLGFYLHTIIPRCYLIQESINARLFERFGLEFEFQPDRLNMVQLAQLLEAQTLKDLTGGKPIMTRDEARTWIGLGPWPENEPDPMDPTENPNAKPVGQGAAPDVAESDDMEPEADPGATEQVTQEQAKAWLRASLANVRAGKSAAVGTPWDGELIFATSGRMVRAVFESHWPRNTDDMAAAIRKAADALAEHNRIMAQAKG